jgi:hypothetical protein
MLSKAMFRNWESRKRKRNDSSTAFISTTKFESCNDPTNDTSITNNNNIPSELPHPTQNQTQCKQHK